MKVAERNETGFNGGAVEAAEASRRRRLPVGIFHNITRKMLEKSSRLARDVFYHGPGSWQALRTIYEDRPEGFLERAMYPVTLGLDGSRDTRNRLEIYTGLITEAMENGCRKYLDLACGCSFAPIRTARRIRDRLGEDGCHIRCSDISQSAIEYSRNAAEKEGVSRMMSFAVYGIGRVDEFEEPESFDAVGTHGYLDYKTIPEAVRLVRKIGKVIRPGGLIITTNMKIKEGFDLTRFMMQFYGDWFIKYKTREEMEMILQDAGFDGIDVIETPLGHHYMATGTKR